MNPKSLIRLCRVHQYTKNAFIFAPLFFAARMQDFDILLRVCYAFIAYCLLASAVYIFNDMNDREVDRLHPTKCKRPIASGEVSAKTAAVLAVLLALSAGIITLLLVPEIIMLLGLYAGMNLAYSLWLKHFSLVDVSIISLGFVIRLYVGGVASNLPLSHWIVIITFLLALFLALAKRRDDVVLSARGERTRKAVDGYNEAFLSTSMAVVASVVVVAYLMYSISAEVVARVGDDHLFFTSFFVIMGFLRYMQITFVEGKSGSPSKLVLKDRFLQITIVLWLAVFGYIIY